MQLAPARAIPAEQSGVPQCSGANAQSRRAAMIAFLAYVALAIGLQWLAGAGRAFQIDSDEPAHYLTALMFHDYVKSGLPESPLVYAARYYGHFPAVGAGHWPPLFHLVLAVWMFIFGTTESAGLLLSAIITAAVATVLHRLVARTMGPVWGWGAGFIFVTARLVQLANNEIMADCPGTLCALLALLAAGRFLETARRRDAVWYGVWSAAAILIKLNFCWIAFMLPLGILLTGRYSLIRRLNTWIPFGIMAGLCLPWFIPTRTMAAANWNADPQPVTHVIACLRFLLQYVPLVPLAALGGVLEAAAWRRLSPTRRLLAVQPFVVIAFLAPVPAGMFERYLLPVLPIMICFLLAGAFWLSERLPLPLGPRARAGVAVGVCAALAVMQAGLVQAETRTGMRQAARAVAADAHLRSDIILAAPADWNGSDLIADLASLDAHRPFDISVVRANKVLASWAWTRYRTRFRDAAEMEAFLEKNCVGVVVSREAANPPIFYQQLMQAIGQYPDKWRLVGEFGSRPAVSRVYHMSGHCPSASSNLPEWSVAQILGPALAHRVFAH
jgi:hypothetical protein